jgi:hypothetical protein
MNSNTDTKNLETLESPELTEKWIIHIQSPPKEATSQVLTKYFSKFGKVMNIKMIKSQHIEAEELKQKLRGNCQAQSDLDLDNRMLNSALMECESEQMKKKILSNIHFLGKKVIKVREYMTK